VGKRIFLIVCLLVWVASESVASPAAKAISKGSAVKQAEPVSYVGCLRSTDRGQQFVLENVAGRDVPRARSWKTAFITRKTVTIEVIGVRGVKLREYVGHTVRVTGQRTGHRVHAEAVKSMTNSCF
jgi:hypothetical protein